MSQTINPNELVKILQDKLLILQQQIEKKEVNYERHLDIDGIRSESYYKNDFDY